jgi:hypothetical protein
MARQVTFTSERSIAECAQRLQQLSARRHLCFARSGRTVHVTTVPATLTRAAPERYTFTLHATASPHSARGLPALVYLQATGALTRVEDDTRVRIRLGLGTPTSPTEWILIILWHFILAVALLVGVVGAGALPRSPGILTGSLILLAYVLYAALLRSTYRRAVEGLADTLRQGLTDPSTETPT